jgi:photosystem II stability/assembly factor-like uncharacterized protein
VIAVPPPAGNAIEFVDARHGWAGGRGGLVGTKDGRRFVVESHAHVVGLSAVDRRHAWAITNGGGVLRTTDGVHWRRLVSPHLVRLRFVDARRGFALTRRGILVKSVDAGVIWRRMHAPGTVQSFCFSDARNGIVARGGKVWLTHDGGRRWQKRKLLPDRGGYPVPETGCRGSDRWVLFHEGVAAGSEGYVVFRSRDAGASWRPVLANLDLAFTRRAPRISPGYSGPFDVLGAGRAVFVGICGPCGKQPTGTIARTSNGGRSWQRATPFDGVWVDAISFLDVRRGFALTSSRRGRPRAGAIWRTSDGGRTWKGLATSSVLAPS